jgi:type I restriction enzyme S subunit
MSDWKTYRIGELITDIGDGGTPSRDTPENFGGDIAWAVIDDIQHEIWGTKETLSRRGFLHSSSKLWAEETVILSTGATIGEVGIAKIPLTTKQGICGLVCGSLILPEFLYYKLQSLKPYLNAIAQGSTIKEVRPPTIKQIKIEIPTTKEQSKIVDVLIAIEHTIAQTEALIAKHQQIKTGLMQDLLTRGIDEYGQLRDLTTHKFKHSRLGSIPEEWEESTIGKISHRVTSGSRWWARYYTDDGAKFIRIGNLTREHVNLRLQNIQHVQPPDSSEAKRTVLETGDLLISVTADLGIIGIVPNDLGEAYINQHIALVKLDKEKINPYFIGNLLSGFQAQKYFSLLNDSGAKAGLNLKTISAFPVVFPSDKKEQDRIAEIIQKTDDIIEKQKSERKKLLGVKAGLMQDLLSGRVSVKVLMEG